MAMTTRTCVISGAAGFVGSHLCDVLLARGLIVIGVDDLSLGRRGNLDSALANPRFRFLVGDICDTETVIAFIRNNADHVSPSEMAFWHLAANSDIAAGVTEPLVE